MMNYSEELEKLISEAVIDGALTDQEKQALFKKAESLGIDLDEFEMVLEARLFEQKGKLKSKVENVNKCPLCGAPVESFTTKCSYCGAEIKNVKPSNIVDDGHYPEKHPMTEKINHKEKGNHGKKTRIRFILPILLVVIIAGSVSWCNRSSSEEKILEWASKKMIERTFDINILDSDLQDGGAPVKMQLAILKLELEKVSEFVKNKDYNEARSLLEETKWKVVMSSSDDFDKREKPLIVQFLQQKQKINNSLPKDFQIKIESIEDYKVKQLENDEIQ